jgi:hypothetical protein
VLTASSCRTTQDLLLRSAADSLHSICLARTKQQVVRCGCQTLHVFWRGAGQAAQIRMHCQQWKLWQQQQQLVPNMAALCVLPTTAR